MHGCMDYTSAFPLNTLWSLFTCSVYFGTTVLLLVMWSKSSKALLPVSECQAHGPNSTLQIIPLYTDHSGPCNLKGPPTETPTWDSPLLEKAQRIMEITLTTIFHKNLGTQDDLQMKPIYRSFLQSDGVSAGPRYRMWFSQDWQRQGRFHRWHEW